MTYDHIVIGAGSMGMAAGYCLAREGKKHCCSMRLIRRMIGGAITVKHV